MIVYYNLILIYRCKNIISWICFLRIYNIFFVINVIKDVEIFGVLEVILDYFCFK